MPVPPPVSLSQKPSFGDFLVSRTLPQSSHVSSATRLLALSALQGTLRPTCSGLLRAQSRPSARAFLGFPSFVAGTTSRQLQLWAR